MKSPILVMYISWDINYDFMIKIRLNQNHLIINVNVYKPMKQ